MSKLTKDELLQTAKRMIKEEIAKKGGDPNSYTPNDISLAAGYLLVQDPKAVRQEALSKGASNAKR